MCEDVSPNRTTRGRLLGRIGFQLLLVVIAGSLASFGINELSEARRFSDYEEVVSLVKEGKLKADSSGDILLPKQWARLTANGHVYQIYDRQSGLVILFPMAVDIYLVDWGNGQTKQARDIAGYVYCSGPLPSDGWFSFNGMSGVSTWNRNKAVHPHWYHVEPFGW